MLTLFPLPTITDPSMQKEDPDFYRGKTCCLSFLQPSLDFKMMREIIFAIFGQGFFFCKTVHIPCLGIFIVDDAFVAQGRNGV